MIHTVTLTDGTFDYFPASTGANTTPGGTLLKECVNALSMKQY